MIVGAALCFDECKTPKGTDARRAAAVAMRVFKASHACCPPQSYTACRRVRVPRRQQLRRKACRLWTWSTCRRSSKEQATPREISWPSCRCVGRLGAFLCAPAASLQVKFALWQLCTVAGSMPLCCACLALAVSECMCVVRWSGTYSCWFLIKSVRCKRDASLLC